MTLTVSKISKRHNDKWVLRDISFDVGRGKILGLASENSCGRSTLLKIIQGTEKPNGGTIVFEGKSLTDAVLVSNGAVRSWTKMFAKANGLSESENQITNFELGLDQAKSILLLDNPFSSLDGFQRDSLLEKLKKSVIDKDLCVVLATNSAEDAFTVCHEMLVLSDSYVDQVGSPREIYEKPNSVAAARAIGRCNLITARRITFNNETGLEFQTLIGECRLQVDKTERSALGAITNNVTLAIRPEHISISFGASFPEDNLLKAEIVGVEFLGAFTRIRLNANGLILEALVLRLVGLNVGDECMIGLPPNRILVLKQ